MRKILLFFSSLLFVLCLQAKEHVYKTKLNGDFIYNDVTQIVRFKGNTYTYIRAEETRDGFNMFVYASDEQNFMFEVYSTQSASYIVQYSFGDPSTTQSNSSSKASLYYEGIGEILAEDIASNIVYNQSDYLDNAGITDSNDRARVMHRVADAISLIKEGGVKATASGGYSFSNQKYAHLKSEKEFNKKWGRTKKDNNYYNKIAFDIIDQAARATSGRLSDEEIRKDVQRINRQSLSATSVNWRQVIKDEIIAYDVQ